MTTPGKEKTLYFIRHAESMYDDILNEPSTWFSYNFWSNGFDPLIKDPSLSKYGHKQVNKMNKLIKGNDFIMKYNIDLIITSPLSRAIDTTLGIFNDNLDDYDDEIVLYPGLREYLDTKADIGLTRKDLIKKYKKHSLYNDIDWDYINRDIWWYNNNLLNKYNIDDISYDELKNGYKIKESDIEFKNRINNFKFWLVSKEESNIVIVGHPNWIKMFANMFVNVDYGDIVKIKMNSINVVDWEFIYVDYDKV